MIVHYNSVSYLNLEIIGIAETHLKKCDVLSINGYKWFGNNRQELHKNAKRGSGGVGFLIKKNI